MWTRCLWMGAIGAALAAGPGMMGCSEVLQFPVETSAQTSIEGDPLGGLLGTIGFPDLATFDISETDEFENQGVNKEDIESVTLTSLSLKVVSPEGQDLSFFESIEFYVESGGLEKVRIAHLESFPEGVSEVQFLIDDVELRDYVAAESMAVTTDVTASAPAQDTTLEAHIAFEVVATPQGACNAIQGAVQ